MSALNFFVGPGLVFDVDVVFSEIRVLYSMSMLFFFVDSGLVLDVGVVFFRRVGPCVRPLCHVFLSLFGPF